jgi:hypothetical protein
MTARRTTARRTTALLAAVAAGLLWTTSPALAQDDRVASCSNRAGPSATNAGSGWLNVVDDGPNWKVVNIYGKVRGVGLPITADNDLVVEVNDLSKGGVREYAHQFSRITNSDITLTANVDPPIIVPKGKLGARIVFNSSLDSWPKNCSAAGLVF